MTCQCPHKSVDHAPSRCEYNATLSAQDKSTRERFALCRDCITPDYVDVHDLP